MKVVAGCAGTAEPERRSADISPRPCRPAPAGRLSGSPGA